MGTYVMTFEGEIFVKIIDEDASRMFWDIGIG